MGTAATCPGELRLSHYRCNSNITDQAFHDWFAKPVVFKDRIDCHMRPREDEKQFKEPPHNGCMPWRHRGEVDLSWLAVSREIKRDALKIFYRTNTFSFTSPVTLGKWLGTIATPATRWSQSLRPPPDLKAIIRKLRLENALIAWSTKNEFDAMAWPKALFILPKHFPDLTTLHLTITIEGYVNCFRESHGFAFVDSFLPLRQLEKLNFFTLVILETQDTCKQIMHDTEMHEKRARDTHFERREIRQIWAEEIRKLVMGEKYGLASITQTATASCSDNQGLPCFRGFRSRALR